MVVVFRVLCYTGLLNIRQVVISFAEVRDMRGASGMPARRPRAARLRFVAARAFEAASALGTRAIFGVRLLQHALSDRTALGMKAQQHPHPMPHDGWAIGFRPPERECREISADPACARHCTLQQH